LGANVKLVVVGGGSTYTPELVSGLAACASLPLRLHGGRNRVVAALLAHPLIGEYDRAESLACDMLKAGSAHLPWVSA
jgi:6-phospho-beta-glucosidase